MQQNVIQVHYKWTVCPCSLLRTFFPLPPGYEGPSVIPPGGGGGLYILPHVFTTVKPTSMCIHADQHTVDGNNTDPEAKKLEPRNDLCSHRMQRKQH